MNVDCIEASGWDSMAYLAAANNEHFLVFNLPCQYEAASWLHIWKLPSHGDRGVREAKSEYYLNTNTEI